MEPTTSRMPTRRTVLRTAVWSTPVIAIAAAAPAFALSPAVTLTFALSPQTTSGNTTKQQLVITGGTTGTVISIGTTTASTGSPPSFPTPTTMTFSGGTVTFLANNGNSINPNTTYTFSVTYNGVTQIVSITTNATSTGSTTATF